MDVTRLQKIINEFYKSNVLVIGDIMLDIYIIGNASRISPEAPVPILNYKTTVTQLGGAVNVAKNIIDLGGNCTLIGTIGKDVMGTNVKSLLNQSSISHRLIEHDRTTTTKIRLVANNQQIARIDYEERIVPDFYQIQSIFHNCISTAHPDVIVISDYDKGIVTPELVEMILSEKKDSLIIADPKVPNMLLYQDIDMITPNRKEAQEFYNQYYKRTPNINQLGEFLLEKLNLKCVLITEGSKGMTFTDFLGNTTKIKAKQQAQIYSVVGAGDTVIATLATALALDIPYLEAIELANIAAGITVRKPFTATVTKDELQAEVEKLGNE